MLDKLLDLIQSWLGLFKFWVVVDEYEQHVLLRLGRYKRTLAPGWHFLLPMADRTMACWRVKNTVKLAEQNVTTADGQDVALTGIVTYKVVDPKVFLLECEGGQDAIADSAFGAIAEWACSNTRDHIRDPRNWRQVRTAIKQAAGEYGIEVLRFKFADNVRAKALRLLGSVNGQGR